MPSEQRIQFANWYDADIQREVESISKILGCPKADALMVAALMSILTEVSRPPPDDDKEY